MSFISSTSKSAPERKNQDPFSTQRILFSHWMVLRLHHLKIWIHLILSSLFPLECLSISTDNTQVRKSAKNILRITFLPELHPLPSRHKFQTNWTRGDSPSTDSGTNSITWQSDTQFKAKSWVGSFPTTYGRTLTGENVQSNRNLDVEMHELIISI